MFFVLGFVLFVLPLRAELAWSRKLVELDLVARPAETTAVFPFRNAGKTPVRIAMALSSCDCATPKLDKETYAAGESGEIRVVFKPDHSRGRVERTIAVITDDSPETPAILTLRIVLPERAGDGAK